MINEIYYSRVVGKVMAGDTDLLVIGLWVGFNDEIIREVQSKRSHQKEEAEPSSPGGSRPGRRL